MLSQFILGQRLRCSAQWNPLLAIFRIRSVPDYSMPYSTQFEHSEKKFIIFLEIGFGSYFHSKLNTVFHFRSVHFCRLTWDSLVATHHLISEGLGRCIRFVQLSNFFLSERLNSTTGRKLCPVSLSDFLFWTTLFTKKKI